MKRFFTTNSAVCVLLLCWLTSMQGNGQAIQVFSTRGVPALSIPERKTIYAYEGFDYFGSTGSQSFTTPYVSSVDDPGTYFNAGATTQQIRPTIFSRPSITAIKLHNVNNELTNSEYALGWAGDWTTASGNATNYTVSNVPLENIISSPLATNEIYSLINVGFYANGGGDAANAVGRRLQTSTAGAFYEYEIWQESAANQTGAGRNDVNNNETPYNATTDFFFSGGVGSGLNIDDRFSKTHPASTIRTLASNAQAHHRNSAGGSHTMNTSIGAQGSTVWLGFLMRLNGSSAQDAYINLHTGAQPYQIDNAKLSVGYFGTTDPTNFNGAGTDKYWGIRINGTSYVNKNADALIVANKFDLLVVSITFDYTAGHQVNFYAIKDNSPRYDDNPPVGGDGIIDAPAATVSQTITGTDLSFHSLAYQGGNSVNRSNIDEIRFGRTYDVAALASRTISVVRDLCETGDGSQAGANVNAGGNLGSIISPTITGTSGEFVGTNAPYNSVYDAASADANYNSSTSPLARVMFEGSATAIGATTYGALAPGFIYNANNGGQPNDGNFYVGSQSRNPFGNVGGGPSWPVWISTYDNSGTQRGNLMVVNASYDRGLYFEQEVSGICPGTQYEFSADIINLFSRRVKTITNTTAPITNYNCGCDNTLEPGCGQFSFAGTDQRSASGLGAATRGSGSDCFGLNPEVEFLIDGVPVYIPPISIDNDEKWHRVGFTFVTKDPPGGKVVIAVRNRAPGGNGNDLAMDNFQFRPCGPTLELNNPGLCSASDVISYKPKGKTFRKPFYRWVIIPCNGSDCITLPANLESDPNKFLVVGDKAFFDPNDAELRIDTISNGTKTVDGSQTFAQVFPGGVVTTGSLIFVYSASEKEANTLSSTCRISGPEAQVICPLPVTLLSFKAALLENKVQLNWQTTEEKNAKEFVIERSADGITFIPIGTLPTLAKAGPQNVKKYQYDDHSPLYGTSYYRLKMVDYDAKYEYSNIESVKMEAKYQIYPNPAREVLYVDVDNRNGNGRAIRFTMYNLLGNKIVSKDLEVAKGGNKLVVRISDLRSGAYVVEISDGLTVFRKSVIIQ